MEEPTETTAPEAPAAPDEATMAAALRIAEAVIFAADRPVSPQTLAAVLPEGVSATSACAALAAAYEGRGVVLAEIGGGYAFRTAADLAPRLTKVVESPRRLPRAAMEALAIIAYHQPCTRGDVEEIRGATLAQTTMESLLELGLVAPRGRQGRLGVGVAAAVVCGLLGTVYCGQERSVSGPGDRNQAYSGATPGGSGPNQRSSNSARVPSCWKWVRVALICSARS